MSKHTPGPWKIETERFGSRDIDYFVVPKNADGGISICEIYRKPYRANARLIAAAPELLEALKEALVVIDSSVFTSTANKVRAAIAKAEGKK